MQHIPSITKKYLYEKNMNNKTAEFGCRTYVCVTTYNDRIQRATLLFCTYTYTFISADFNNNYDDKLVLSPVEMIDMVHKERTRTHELQSARRAPGSHAHRSTRVNAKPVAELNVDESTPKRRKIWSRWGKWGECSVTCGCGFMTRQRVCAAGRCARGELEEQLRPCARPPCDAPPPPPHDTD